MSGARSLLRPHQGGRDVTVKPVLAVRGDGAIASLTQVKVEAH